MFIAIYVLIFTVFVIGVTLAIKYEAGPLLATTIVICGFAVAVTIVNHNFEISKIEFDQKYSQNIENQYYLVFIEDDKEILVINPINISGNEVETKNTTYKNIKGYKILNYDQAVSKYNYLSRKAQ